MSTEPTPGPHAGMYPTINRKPRRWPWIVGIVAAWFVGMVIGAGITADVEPTAAPEPGASAVQADEPEPEPKPEPEPEPEPKYDEPAEDSFELTVKTLEKKCFGSAGCNMTFRIEVAASDPTISLDPSKTYELTYEIKGSEDPYVNTLTLEGDEYITDQEEFVGTAGDVELKAIVTGVSEL